MGEVKQKGKIMRKKTIVFIILLIALLCLSIVGWYIYSRGANTNETKLSDSSSTNAPQYGVDSNNEKTQNDTNNQDRTPSKKEGVINDKDNKDPTERTKEKRPKVATNATKSHNSKPSSIGGSKTGQPTRSGSDTAATTPSNGSGSESSGGGSNSAGGNGGGSTPGDTTPPTPPIKNTHSVASDSQLGGSCSNRNYKGGEYKQFTHANGHTSPYLLHEHADTASHGLIIYLHGDGYGEHTNYCKNNPRTIDPYIEIARTHKMTMIAPRTPDTGTKTWWRASYSAEWLAGLISEIKTMHKVDSNKIWVVGYSGGAEVTSYSLMAKYSYLFTGGGAIMIGGGWYNHSVASQPLSDSVKQNFAMVWLVGERDTAGQDNDGGFDALAASRRGFNHYKQAGIRNIEHKVISNTGHYNYGSAGPDNLSRLIK